MRLIFLNEWKFPKSVLIFGIDTINVYLESDLRFSQQHYLKLNKKHFE